MKKLLTVLLAMALVLSMAACSNPQQPVGGSPPDSQERQVTLKLGIPEGASLTPQEIVDNFKRDNPNITLVTDETPWADFKTKLQTQIAGGNPPDVFFTDGGLTATLGAKGAAMDLSDFIQDELDDSQYSSMLYAAKDAEGHIWGVPHGVNPIAIAYNKAMFDEAQIPYPTEDWTFDQLFEIAEKLTRDTDGDGQTDIYGLLTDVRITQGWLPFITAAGGAPLDSTMTKANFDDPKTIEGLNKWYSAIHELGITPPRAWLESFGGYWQAFVAGKAAMFIMQASNATNIKQAASDLDYDVAMMPTGWDGQKHVCYVANHWVVFSRATDDAKTAALKWVKHYLGEESQSIYAQTCPAGYPIQNKALEIVASAELSPKNKSAFINGMDQHGVSLFENPTWNEWVTETNKIMLDLYDGKIDPETAAKQTQEKVQSILDSAQ